MNWTRELRQKEYEKKRQDYSKAREEKKMLEADCTNCCHVIRGECEYDSVGLEDGEMYCGSYEKR
jgi:hypothetical protein